MNTNASKIIVTGLFAFLALIVSVSASSYGGQDPYSGVNTIGTYYQYSNTAYFGYAGGGNYYDYMSPPREGGWFGSGSEWITGLRTPQYVEVPPVHYTNYYAPVCGNRCWFGGGYGYPMAHASDFGTTRSRPGGVFSY